MPKNIAESLEVFRLEILGPEGTVDEALMPDLSGDQVREMFELIVLSRTFDRLALNLQREGRLGTYPSLLGQEASQVGSAFALRKSDWVFPSYRETGVLITLGYPLSMLFQYWAGNEQGLKTPEGLNIFPPCIPVGTQTLHAVGAAMAAGHLGDRIAAAAYLGDGGTSKGDFHEGMNMAGVFRLPVVVICQNNHWAISVPRERQTASRTIAQKAWAYGFEGVQVDGNDLFAVYSAAREALERARNGEGPSFIECVTYRMSDHTTADDASRYRSAQEVEAWRERDPLKRLRLFMKARGLWSDDYEKAVTEKAVSAVSGAVKEEEAATPPEARDMFTYTYRELTERLKRQAQDAESG